MFQIDKLRHLLFYGIIGRSDKSLNEKGAKMRGLRPFYDGTGDVLLMTIVYRDKNGDLKNYDVDVRELGIIKSHDQQYRIHGNTKELMKKLVDWIRLSESNSRSVS